MTFDDSDSGSDSSPSDIGCSGDSDHGYQGHSYGFSSDYPDDDSTPTENSSRSNDSSSGILKAIAGIGLIGLCTFGGVKTLSYAETQLQIRDPSRAAYGGNIIAPVIGGLGGLLISGTALFLYSVRKR
ncbi:MAG: hypothetical protein WCI72_03175 [archaeon]